jgi:hypothetical protein
MKLNKNFNSTKKDFGFRMFNFEIKYRFQLGIHNPQIRDLQL